MSSFDKQKIFTYVLSGSILNISETFGVTVVALKLTAGSGSYTGTKFLGSLSSAPIPLTINEGTTISADSSKYIDELIIDATSGTIEVIAR